MPVTFCFIEGIGLINGIYTVITANDGSVKGGTIFPITLAKQSRLQQIIMENKLPAVYIIDSGGAFLPLQVSYILCKKVLLTFLF